jgi:hypothetical protein
LHDYSVNGHRVDYQGNLIVAFRLGADDSLTAFGGYDCASIRINGRAYTFAERPMPHLAWAPVTTARRVPNGAVMELWVHGQGSVKVPAPAELTNPRLVFQGARLDSPGSSIPVKVENGNVTFQADDRWPQKHLYLVTSQ